MTEDDIEYLRWWANPTEQVPRMHEHAVARAVLAELDRLRARVAQLETAGQALVERYDKVVGRERLRPAMEEFRAVLYGGDAQAQGSNVEP